MALNVLIWGTMLILIWLTFFRKPPHMPPGKWGLPLIGYIPLTLTTLQQQLQYMQEKFGDMYIWRLGTQVLLILNDQDLVKEAFSKEEFIERPQWNSFMFMEKEKLGVLFSEGQRWRNNRRFTLRQLRDLGMGKSKLVAAVQMQAELLVEELKKQAQIPALLPHALALAPLNIVWKMVADKQFNMNDPVILAFDKTANDFTSTFIYMAIPDFLPWLRHILPSSLLRRIFRFDLGEKLTRNLFTFFEDVIKEHKATLDRNNPRDLIDGYLIEMQDRNDDPDNTFCENDLNTLLLDIFFAGSETTSHSLIWMIYYLASNPEVQRKMQAEIDAVLPKGTLPTMQDRPNLPYVDAVIHETMRKSALVAFGLPHVASRDTTLRGYNIPKGTILMSSVWSIHHDPRVWENPDQFRPERWIDEDGKFIIKPGILPFSLGKRQCAGENLARMELFIFATAILQNVTFSVPPGKTLNLNPVQLNPFLHRHYPQDLIITVRD